MAKSEYPVRSRRRKMHPLFAELYLSGGPDGAGDAQEERPGRLRRRASRKRTIRRA
jgi:hypothetical protein